MREFMDNITNAFFAATGWNRDNSYSELNATTNGKVDTMLPSQADLY
jgi:distribution and morphology protein 10